MSRPRGRDVATAYRGPVAVQDAVRRGPAQRVRFRQPATGDTQPHVAVLLCVDMRQAIAD